VLVRAKIMKKTSVRLSKKAEFYADFKKVKIGCKKIKEFFSFSFSIHDHYICFVITFMGKHFSNF
jgi:hypothetical protein